MNNYYDFTPTDEPDETKIIFYEEARADYAPYYSSSKSIDDAKKEVLAELSKLGAGVLSFQEGTYGDNPKRHGYQITFNLRGMTGVIRVAGLPMRKPTDSKKDSVRAQALLNVRDWLKASVTQPVFSPGSNPLLMNLLVDGRRTMAEAIVEDGYLPALLDERTQPKPNIKVVGEITDGEF